MWIIKLAGTLMLVCSGWSISHKCNVRATAALRQNEGYLSLLRTVRGQIECFARPIGEILASCENTDFYVCGYLGDESPKDLGTLLAGCQWYDVPTRSIVSRFAEEFGRGYREEEVKACDYALSLLDARRESLAAELPQIKRRNTALWVCGSLAIALLLL